MPDFDTDLFNLVYDLKELGTDINVYRNYQHRYLEPEVNHKLGYLVSKLSYTRNKLNSYEEIAFNPEARETPKELQLLIKDYAKLSDCLNDLPETEELVSKINEVITQINNYNYLIPKSAIMSMS